MKILKCDSCGYIQPFTKYKCKCCADGYNLREITVKDLLIEYKKLFFEYEKAKIRASCYKDIVDGR
jgi:hypothetical protein